MSGFFITGTDTGIGKTFVSSLLIKLLVAENLNVIGMKPVASGAKIIDGELKNADALSLIEASNVNVAYENINPYVFKEAVSPHIAAEEAGVEIDLDVIKTKFNLLENKSDIVMVEAVGGWYAPLSQITTVADLAKMLNIPIIIVVGLRLGCLNHALLTVQAVRQSGLPIMGWVANQIDKKFSFVDKNIATLKATFKDISYLGFIPHAHQNKKNNNNKILSSSGIELTTQVNKSLLLDYLDKGRK